MTRPNLQGIEVVVDGKYMWIRPDAKAEELPEEESRKEPGKEKLIGKKSV